MEEYFIPCPEEVVNNYKCEILMEDDSWHEARIDMEVSQVRTAYITEKDFNEEGWRTSLGEGDVRLFKKSIYTLGYNWSKKTLKITKGGEVLFNGKCKDINTFRFIMRTVM